MSDEAVQVRLNNDSGTRMRRIALTVDIEIPEIEFADLAATALATGGDLRAMLAARYLTRAGDRPTPSARPAGTPPYRVGDFRHLFGSAPAGSPSYRGVGRAPAWLHALIQQEIAGR